MNEMSVRRISQRALAHRSGVNHSTISRLLADERSPSFSTVARLALALGAPLPRFLGRVASSSTDDARIRVALANIGLATSDIEAMLATYRRSQLDDRKRH